MVDAESVRRRLREIDRRLTALRDIEGVGATAFLAEAGVQAQAERHLQLAIQAAIDIAIHLVAEESPETPEDYGDAFVLLSKLGIVEESLAVRLRSAAGLRNILVHAYLEVDPARIWAHFGHLVDLERFALSVEHRLPR